MANTLGHHWPNRIHCDQIKNVLCMTEIIKLTKYFTFKKILLEKCHFQTSQIELRINILLLFEVLVWFTAQIAKKYKLFVNCFLSYIFHVRHKINCRFIFFMLVFCIKIDWHLIRKTITPGSHYWKRYTPLCLIRYLTVLVISGLSLSIRVNKFLRNNQFGTKPSLAQ